MYKLQEGNEENPTKSDVSVTNRPLETGSSAKRDAQREIRLSKRLTKTHFSKLQHLKPFCLRSVGSTQDYISAMDNSQEGWFVISETQTQGRGREGRTWVSDRGGLYVSIRLEPPAHLVDKITSLCAVSLLRAMRTDCSLKGYVIKPPNDIMCNGKKIGGVLVDVIEKGQKTVAFAGMGVNLNNGYSWEKELLAIATSYRKETNKRTSIDSFLIKLLSNLDDEYATLMLSHC